MSHVHFDRDFVFLWGGCYANTEKEQELLSQIGPAVARRGYYKKEELAQVGGWKSARIRKRLAQNSGTDVEDITRIALAAPERHSIACWELFMGSVTRSPRQS